MAAFLFRTLFFTKALQLQKKKEEESKAKKSKNIPSVPVDKLKHLCIICCKEQGTIPIFHNLLRPRLAQEIETFANVTMTKSIYVKEHICPSCLKLLDCCIKFKGLCETSCKLLATCNTATASNNTATATSPAKVIKNESSGQEDTYDYLFPHTVLSSQSTAPKQPKTTKRTCKHCLKEFENRVALNEHKPCPVHLRTIRRFKINRMKTSGQTNDPKVERSCLCTVCGKRLTTPQTLIEHMKTHSNNFRFQCKLCPYKGRTRNLLLIHTRSHLAENERPYKCTHCPKTTSTASNLNAHMRRAHSTSRPYKCDQCEKAFTCTQSLKKHMQDVHIPQENVDCEVCYKTFSKKKALQKHLRNVHHIKSSNLPHRLPSYLQQSLDNGNSWKESAEDQHEPITEDLHQL